jgi:protein-tyrosine-phosphatase
MTSSTRSTQAAATATAERLLVAVARALTPLLAVALRPAPVKRLLHGRAVAAWNTAREPLVLCYGNINRSPFAAVLAGKSSPTRSSGLYPEAGRPASELAIEQARLHGADLTRHRSTLVTDEQLRKAEAIFVFDAENLARLAARSPAALLRTHLFASLAPAGMNVDPLIADPHGHERDVATRAFAQIATVVDSLTR